MAVQKEFEYEYNPIKEIKGNAEASKVVWSTKSLETAVEALSKGMQLKANPFCGTNTKLLKPDLVYKRTKEEVEDTIKCMQDTIYFGNKCTLMTPEGLKKVTMRDYQEDYLRHLQKNRFSIYLSCRQSGKCLSLLTDIKLKYSDIFKNIKDIYEYSEYDNSITIPLFELYNIYCKQSILWKLKYKLYKLYYEKINDDTIIKIIQYLIFILDKLQYGNIKDKMVDTINTDNLYISTDTGFKLITNIYLTKPFEQYTIILENGYSLICADTHILFDENYNEIFVKDLKIGNKVITDDGPKRIISISANSQKVCMGDITVNDDNHRFWSNGILSHNSTTTGIYALHKALFRPDTNILILSKSAAAGRDLLKKIKDMYMYLPYYLKCGTLKWNQTSISFDNNSTISTEAFSSTAGLGQTINVLILDEFAWCPPNEVELFYNNIIPTVTTISDSNVCIMSTQNGFNLFYKIWKSAIEKKSIYAPFKTDWYQVPQFNIHTKQWDKRDENWHQMMVGILGSEENFQYQYGTQFSASDNCLVSRERLAKIQSKSILYENPELMMQYIRLNVMNALVIDPNYDITRFKQNHYVILCDLAEGIGSDSTVFNILEISVKEDGKPLFVQCGYWKSDNTNLDMSALDFWLLINQLFDMNKILISIEWNTYGALFYTYLMNYNEPFMTSDSFKWRFNYGKELEYTCICQYKKGNIEDSINQTMKFKNSKTIPGIRWNTENKKSACSLLKLMLENEEIMINDVVTVGELENFEDKNGNGIYKASYGHDDIIMTLVQIPMLLQTSKWKNFFEEMNTPKMTSSLFGDNYNTYAFF